MKNLISAVETGLKRLTHRELSPKELEKARQGVKVIKSSLTITQTTEYLMTGGEPQLRINYQEIDDMADFYLDSTIHYFYNRDGKLVKRLEVQRGNIEFNEQFNEQVAVREFDPPGRWRGKKVQQYTNKTAIV